MDGVQSVEGDKEKKLIVASYRGGRVVEELVKKEIAKKGHVVSEELIRVDVKN